MPNEIKSKQKKIQIPTNIKLIKYNNYVYSTSVALIDKYIQGSK